ncbi:MAG: isochorismatase family protein [Desulfosporosinus sp.]|nr:isochorismatase family protein [Desulfosporosinus sp.]
MHNLHNKTALLVMDMQSNLEIILRSHQIDTLVLSGISTSGVVLSTLREAADKDYALKILFSFPFSRLKSWNFRSVTREIIAPQLETPKTLRREVRNTLNQ